MRAVSWWDLAHSTAFKAQGKPKRILVLLFHVRMEEDAKPNCWEVCSRSNSPVPGHHPSQVTCHALSTVSSWKLERKPFFFFFFSHSGGTKRSHGLWVRPRLMSGFKSGFCKVWCSSLTLTKEKHWSKGKKTGMAEPQNVWHPIPFQNSAPSWYLLAFKPVIGELFPEKKVLEEIPPSEAENGTHKDLLPDYPTKSYLLS